ncbi:CPCC family cysteine-rich protein [Pseudomonas kribbensis]|uniref:CPCC family cysteine-rich protein n=1 Tax=Pseudomonas kribbensis TaxID=1628086 RepID=UPI00143094EC|nr:CPCC family cysteine-rich protein [Pseudomonas kribbensis]
MTIPVQNSSLYQSSCSTQSKTNDDLPNNINDSKYNKLIQVALKSKLKGITNIYLSKRLASLKLGDYEVYGDIEPLEACPCCGYHTLPSLANYDICDLCHWEDNGTTSLDSYSSPNHMTLREAKESFAKKIRKPEEKGKKGTDLFFEKINPSPFQSPFHMLVAKL